MLESDSANPNGAARVFIVTPIRLYGDGIARCLTDAGLTVVGIAEESGATVPQAVRLRPGIVLLDMVLEDSAATARALRAALPEAQIVALGVPESESRVIDCVEAGVSGYVPRAGSLADLLDTVQSVASGETICSPRIVAGLFRRLAALSSAPERPPLTPAARSLTARESEVVALIEDGLSNKQIARRLCIELPTVKNHVHSILDKLGASSRGEAAARLRGAG